MLRRLRSSKPLAVVVWAVVVVATLWFVAAEARAETTIIEPAGSHFPYQRWVDEAKVPTPDVTLTVIEEPCPILLPGEFAWACTQSGSYTIWDAEPVSPRVTFLHELGHNFDYYALPDWARVRFEALVADSRPWTADPNGPNEAFAAAYERCAATGLRFAGDPNLYIKGNGAAIRQSIYRRICRMIFRIGSPASPQS